MLKKFIIAAFSVLSSFAIAENDMSCMVQVAVATPPVSLDENVAFNITSDYGFSKSITLRGGSGPQFIDGIPCSEAPLTISASSYATPSNAQLFGPIIGRYVLKAGVVVLAAPGNSVSVVFPHDFICNDC